MLLRFKWQLNLYYLQEIHPTKKKCCHSKILFIHLSISLSFLEFEWKILYRWKANILNFFMMQKNFLYFEQYLSYQFLNKNRVFFPHIKKIISPVRIKKNFFWWKLLVALIILQKSFWKKNVCIDDYMMVWIWVWFSDKGISLILLRF